jgi:MFS family permease
MRFWILLAIRYALAVLAAGIAAFLTAFFVMMAMSSPNDDSPGLGILFFLTFFLGIILILPVALGFTAEFAQRKVEHRRLLWKWAWTKALLASPISLALFYYLAYVWSRMPDNRPHHWQMKEVLLIAVAIISGYFALRVRRVDAPIAQATHDAPPQSC